MTDALRVRADLLTKEVVQTSELEWTPSPLPGVARRMLDRVGDEVARATSLVRYDPGSRFTEHTHDLGEEFLVLEGTFSDEHGDYPAGTYVRNPPGSRHAPFTREGCTIFVKLRQFDLSDTTRVVVDTRRAPFRPGHNPGLTVLPLHSHGVVHSALVRWAPGSTFLKHRHFGGEEVLVLEGIWSDEHGDYPPLTWLRSPHQSVHEPFSRGGCLIYVKVGHLLQPADPPPAP